GARPHHADPRAARAGPQERPGHAVPRRRRRGGADRGRDVNDSFAKVAVVGSGTMGNGIAQVLAHAGKSVALIEGDERRLSAATAAIEKSLLRIAKKGGVTEAEVTAILGRIRCATRLEECRDADCVIEAVSEDVALKKCLFADIDKVAPPAAVLAS